ncbi:MAG: lysophospholipid acyltransferase family protein [Novosphingobium sp.]
MARAGDIPRSIAFYVAFYVGTVPYVMAAFAALAIGERPFRRVVRGWSRYHRACVRHLLGIRLEIRGAPPPPDAMVAMKHESFFEAIDQPALFDDPVVLAKAELLRIPMWGRIAAAYGLIPVERDQGARALRTLLTAARARTQDGRRLVIFPEGTRVVHGEAPTLQAGFAALYKLLGVPVVPVSVDSGLLYHRWWKRRGTITIAFGEPIAPGLPRAEIEARVRDAINALNEG